MICLTPKQSQSFFVYQYKTKQKMYSKKTF